MINFSIEMFIMISGTQTIIVAALMQVRHQIVMMRQDNIMRVELLGMFDRGYDEGWKAASDRSQDEEETDGS